MGADYDLYESTDQLETIELRDRTVTERLRFAERNSDAINYLEFAHPPIDEEFKLGMPFRQGALDDLDITSLEDLPFGNIATPYAQKLSDVLFAYKDMESALCAHIDGAGPGWLMHLYIFDNGKINKYLVEEDIGKELVVPNEYENGDEIVKVYDSQSFPDFRDEFNLPDHTNTHWVDIRPTISSGSDDNPEDNHFEKIKQGENENQEFKETFQYDANHEKKDKNKKLKEEVVKEIVGLANTQGGRVYIGVDDYAEVVGLQRDFDLLDGGKQEFEEKLEDIISSRIGADLSAEIISVRFCAMDDKDVCIVKVDKSPVPVFYDEDEFYIRSGSSTRPVTGNKMQDYIDRNWS